MKRVDANLSGAVKRGKLTAKGKAVVLARVTGTLTYDAFKDADMVIEAAVERVDLKQRIFADLERVCRPDCVLSSNTSTIDLSVVAAKTQAAKRVVGAHFFSPAHVMPLLEIVRTDATDPQAREWTRVKGWRV